MNSYTLADATAEELRVLLDYLDRLPVIADHVIADLEWWVTGKWKLDGKPYPFTSMGDMLSHLRTYEI